MDESELVARYPRLFHMATAGSWELIREHGLLTTKHLAETSELSDGEVEELLGDRRKKSIHITHPQVGSVTIRDQVPLRREFVEPKLVHMTFGEWLAVLNDRVFFWLHPNRLEGLLNARLYRSKEQDVITVDTAALLRDYRDRIALSPINSGAALWRSAPARGEGTFQRIADYPFTERRKGRSDATAIAELAVVGGVPDVRDYVLRVERRRGAATLQTLFAR